MMRADLYQACSILASARMALRSHEAFIYNPSQYENSTTFQFLLWKRLWRTKVICANSVPEWFDRFVVMGLSDVQYWTATTADDIRRLGYANESPNILVCFFHDGTVRYFGSSWHFEPVSKGWEAIYTEIRWKTGPKVKFHWEDPTSEFLQVLIRIEAFARQIGCNEFVEVFFNAQAVLKGDVSGGPEPSLPLPEHNRRLFEAAGVADVFGLMGSWNDSPPGIADDLGLRQEYDELSHELWRQLRLAVLYAINEW